MTDKPKFNMLAALVAKQQTVKPAVVESPIVQTIEGNLEEPTVEKPKPVNPFAKSAPGLPKVIQPPPASPMMAGLAQVAKRREAALEDHSYLFAEIPRDFKELLDKFDATLERDTGITDFNIDLCRAYVKRIMVDLKEQPELDGLIIDRDVRNVIQFIRSVKGNALAAVVEKKAKAEKKASTKPAASRFGSSLGVLDFGATKIPASLEDFSEFKDLDL